MADSLVLNSRTSSVNTKGGVVEFRKGVSCFLTPSLIIIIIIIIIVIISNAKPEEKFGSCTRKTFDRFTTKDSYTWNTTHNTESTAV